jgi:hypothetical protein
MDVIWLVAAFWAGGCAGMLVFACLQVARDQATEARAATPITSFIGAMESDTVAR